MRLIDADAMIADLLTVDPQYETMIKWCCTVVDAQPTIEPSAQPEATGQFSTQDDKPVEYKTVSAQPEQRWIPCSERLPDSPIRVLIQIDNDWIVTAYYEDGWWWTVPDWDVDVNADNMYALPINWNGNQYQILAWMPLPEPYKEKEGEKTKHYETN